MLDALQTVHAEFIEAGDFHKADQIGKVIEETDTVTLAKLAKLIREA